MRWPARPRDLVPKRGTQTWCLVPRGTRRTLALPPQAEKNLAEAKELGRSRAGACERLGLRVLQLNQLADTVPGRALSERLSEIGEEGFFVVPVEFVVVSNLLFPSKPGEDGCRVDAQ